MEKQWRVLGHLTHSQTSVTRDCQVPRAGTGSAEHVNTPWLLSAGPQVSRGGGRVLLCILLRDGDAEGELVPTRYWEKRGTVPKSRALGSHYPFSSHQDGKRDETQKISREGTTWEHVLNQWLFFPAPGQPARIGVPICREMERY